MLVSGLAGFAFGGLLGKILDQITPLGPKTTGKEILLYGSAFGISTATLIGIAISIKTKVVIKGDQATYEKKKNTLQKFLIKLEIPTESK